MEAFYGRRGQGSFPPMVSLALSGGGEMGAFGAGLLTGWTASGTRPEFVMVTGVSTGALISVFAFLGPDYDEELKAFYTNVTSKDIYEPRPLFGLFADSMASTKPLRKLIRRHIDKDLLEAVAAEYNKGKVLYVATTNLDAGIGVGWDMGKIAASGHPEAVRLFQDVLIASSAIPVSFPPQFIDVEVDGKRYQEMHVDGEVMNQIFFDPTSFHLRQDLQKLGVEKVPELVYVIENAQLESPGSHVKPRTIDIATHAISSLVLSATHAELENIYWYTQRNNVEFNLAYVPSDFPAPRPHEFNRDYMRRLFDYAYELAAKGYPWQKAPPSIAEQSSKGRR